MGRGTKSHVEHYKKRDDSKKGCNQCGAIATRWMNLSRYGYSRWVSTAYCDNHGDWELSSPNVKVGRMRKQV